MNSLMLDTPTSGPCSRNEAFNKVLIPEITRSYQPLPNKVLIDMIYRIAEEEKVLLTNEQLGMDLKGQRFFGVCDIENEDFFGGAIKMMIGFCNSYNGSMSARFCIGSSVFVCSNRSFHAYTDKQTGISGMAVRPHKNLNNCNIHEGLALHIREAFEQIGEFCNTQERFYECLLNRRISDNKAYATIVRAAQQGIINKTKVLTIANEWNRQAVEPEDTETCEYEWYKEFQDRNAYSFFNAFTQVGKEKLRTNPVQYNMGTIELTNFFYKEFRIN